MEPAIEMLSLFTFGAQDDDPPKKDAVDEDDDLDEDDEPSDPKDRKIQKLSKENYKRRHNEKDLQDRIKQLEGELDDAKNNNDSDGAKWQRKYEALDGKYKDLERTTHMGAIRSAILGNEAYKWHDVNMIISQLDMDDLAVDFSDGTVGGLEDQLKGIAKKKPFLMRNASPSGEQEGTNGKPTGDAPQSSAAGNRDQEVNAKEEDLMRDFPALQMGRI